MRRVQLAELAATDAAGYKDVDLLITMAASELAAEIEGESR